MFVRHWDIEGKTKGESRSVLTLNVTALQNGEKTPIHNQNARNIRNNSSEQWIPIWTTRGFWLTLDRHLYKKELRSWNFLELGRTLNGARAGPRSFAGLDL